MSSGTSRTWESLGSERSQNRKIPCRPGGNSVVTRSVADRSPSAETSNVVL